ncbi:SDR family oxidoreductase [Aliifodinibius sp. S!AR15-10]|uniref:SDR family oxidoreductase n=1 Tax=Aliifodinibius sp. S!AR15-10 TaxID=2950437 RepID=UPI0028571AD3|nr:SDR family oxidoreductase [Aliifodinibius sp. S!AR15-10]MDR8391323.1 SDR family oxidoreductase [Aliifodinibius sp. S!AR15-10]
MKILLTGATGYIAKRLLPVLLDGGHTVVCCVRDKKRFDTSKYNTDLLEVIELDFLEPDSLDVVPEDINVAYYLIHSMASAGEDFESLEQKAAQNFTDRIQRTQAEQIIYLSGIVNSEELSKHLRSRKQVEDILASGSCPLTTLRAGIIVGSGSASFEIIRDLVEKLPVMIAPKWLNTPTQPIAIRNVIQFLGGVLGRKETFGNTYDIGGPEVLTYKEMLQKFAKVRNLKRRIITVPVMSPRLSSYWLYFVTSTSYRLAVNLVNSMKVEVVAKENELDQLLGIELIPYDEAIQLAFDKVEQQEVLSSWTDARSSKVLEGGISNLIEVPSYGCFKDQQSRKITDEQVVIDKIWAIGGKTGWYYGNWLWEIRGFLDKLVGGVGLRRGRKSSTEITAGDSLDFWRVLYADKKEKRLLLYAEMKLPGEAWLEFRITDNTLYQVATFRPLGVWGRLYWYTLLPFHGFIFDGMINKITEVPDTEPQEVIK